MLVKDLPTMYAILAFLIIVAVVLAAMLVQMIWQWVQYRKEQKRIMKEVFGFEKFKIVDFRDDDMGIGVEEWDAMHDQGVL